MRFRGPNSKLRKYLQSRLRISVAFPRVQGRLASSEQRSIPCRFRQRRPLHQLCPTTNQHENHRAVRTRGEFTPRPSLMDSRYSFAKRSLFSAGVSFAFSSPLSLGSTSSALRSMSSKASDPLPPECKSSSAVCFFPFPFADRLPLVVRSIFLLEDGPESLRAPRFRFRVFLEEKNESGIVPFCKGQRYLCLPQFAIRVEGLSARWRSRLAKAKLSSENARVGSARCRGP